MVCRAGADECVWANMDERMTIKILPALFFLSDPEEKWGYTDIVAGIVKQKKNLCVYVF